MSRTSIIERDYSGFINTLIDQTGATVIRSRKGTKKPMKIQSEQDVLTYLGAPSAEFYGVFEAIAFTKEAPLWVSCAIGDNAYYGGVDVKLNEMTAFSLGRDFDTFSFEEVRTKGTYEIGTGNETATQFTGTIDSFPIINTSAFKIFVDGVQVDAVLDKDGNLTGNDIASSPASIVQLADGVFDINFKDAPKNGSVITCTFEYAKDESDNISHSFFTLSPQEDDLAIQGKYLSGSKFFIEIYKKNGGKLKDYTYSLLKEKDGFGRSLYYEDVFIDNPYVQIKVNTAFTGTVYTVNQTTPLNFAGGSRGDEPQASDYLASWNYFQYANKYKAKIFFDIYGNSAATINNLIQTYQPWAQGITVTPLGTSASTALTYRSTLEIDSDDIGLYTNWCKIQDDYNNSFAWISNAGSIARKFAQMGPSYDAASPAGLDENGMGGQIADWRVVEIENDYTQAELDAFYNAQINPLIFDESYGLLIYGDQTLQVTKSDTSFVGTRRLYKYMLDVISKQILRKQEFKINDPLHRLMAKVQTESFVSPIKADGWIRDFKIVCDESNNNDDVLNNRQFILDFYVKITPNSQWIILRLTRLAQNINIEDITGA